MLLGASFRISLISKAFASDDIFDRDRLTNRLRSAAPEIVEMMELNRRVGYHLREGSCFFPVFGVSCTPQIRSSSRDSQKRFLFLFSFWPPLGARFKTNCHRTSSDSVKSIIHEHSTGDTSFTPHYYRIHPPRHANLTIRFPVLRGRAFPDSLILFARPQFDAFNLRFLWKNSTDYLAC